MAVSEHESSSSSASERQNANRDSRSTSSNTAGSCYLAKTVLRGSVVLQAVYGRFRSLASYDVVFGKETSIELAIITEDSGGVVQSITEQPVFGTVKDIAVLPWNERFQAHGSKLPRKDILLVISDSGKLSFLSFCNEMHRFLPLTHIQLSAPGNSRHEVGRMLTVDSSGCFVAASAYEDQLVIFSLSFSSNGEIIDKRIYCPPEKDGLLQTDSGFTNISGTIWSMCFISKENSQSGKEHKPVLAIILNRRGFLYRNELLLLEWNVEEQAIHVLYKCAGAGLLAHHIVEVPRVHGYALLFRAGDVILMDFRNAHNPSCVYRANLNFTPFEEKKNEHVVTLSDIMDEEGMYCVAASALLKLRDINKNYDPMNIDDYSSVKPGCHYVCSWSWEPGDSHNPKIIFSADTGDIYVMEILVESDDIRVNLSTSLYKGLPSKVLLWLDDGFVAAILDMTDGMLLKFEKELLCRRSLIQNIAPILDMSFIDYPEKKSDRMFACSGMAPEGSLRIIRSGISVEKLLETAPIYQGITGTWTLKMEASDPYHSFVVLSFVEETRVLSVGISFSDVTDSVGFLPDVCTLACGLVANGVMVQIHRHGVRLCLPTGALHSKGVPLASPICTSWFPNNMSISLGAVGDGIIIVATSSPCFLFILGIRASSTLHYELYEIQHVKLQNEVSCFSISQKHLGQNKSLVSYGENHHMGPFTNGNNDYVFVIGTHKPSVEIVSFTREKGLQIFAIGVISLTNTMGATISGCVPQDVRLVFVDRLYVLSGLRNGMLLRFEWPVTSTLSSARSPCQLSAGGSCMVNTQATWKSTSPNHKVLPISLPNASGKAKGECPVNLQLIAVRRIGITPVFLVSLGDSLDADVIALSDRPWLVHTARHSLSYTSISFQPSTHVTPVCSVECPRGILFVAENSLHLVEMVPSRLNVQKFHLGGTPRKVLYHNESKLLLVMRTDLDNDSCSSDICYVDPVTGCLSSSFKFEIGETGKCMNLVKVGNEHVLVVGTSLSAGPGIMPSGEAESTKGRLVVLYLEQQLSSSSHCSGLEDNSCDGIKLEKTEAWNLRFACSTTWPGMVLAVCPYLDRYFLASAGSAFYVCSFPNDNSQRVRRLAVGRTRFTIMTLTAHFTRIAVGDCRDGILFYLYHEDSRKLEQVYCDPVQRLVGDCMLMDVDTAVVSDRKGSIAVMSCANHLEDDASPERNLTVSCSYYMGEISISIRKRSFSYKLPADDPMKDCDAATNVVNLSHNCIMASTLLGSIIILIPLTREEYELLEEVQSRLVIHPLTAPVLGNDHNEYRRRTNLVGTPTILDGDILSQFLELTSMQQEAVLALPLASPNTVMLSLRASTPVMVDQVVRLLERVHDALN